MLLTQAEPLVERLWKHESQAEPLATPEQKAGLRRRLIDHASTISDHVRDEYRAEMLPRSPSSRPGTHGPRRARPPLDARRPQRPFGSTPLVGRTRARSAGGPRMIQRAPGCSCSRKRLPITAKRSRPCRSRGGRRPPARRLDQQTCSRRADREQIHTIIDRKWRGFWRKGDDARNGLSSLAAMTIRTCSSRSLFCHRHVGAQTGLAPLSGGDGG